MNVFCFGGNVSGSALALELTEKFLGARFSGAPRHQRRIAKVRALETLMYSLTSMMATAAAFGRQQCSTALYRARSNRLCYLIRATSRWSAVRLL